MKSMRQWYDLQIYLYKCILIELTMIQKNDKLSLYIYTKFVFEYIL